MDVSSQESTLTLGKRMIYMRNISQKKLNLKTREGGKGGKGKGKKDSEEKGDKDNPGSKRTGGKGGRG